MKPTEKQLKAIEAFFTGTVDPTTMAQWLREVAYGMAMQKFKNCDDAHWFEENHFYYLIELSNVLAGKDWITEEEIK